MKKILSILGSLSLIIVAPLNVIACKTEELPEPPKDYDFAKTLNDFVDSVTSIFKTSIYQAFSPYAWINEEDLPNGLTIQELLNNEANLKDHKSDFYKSVSEEIFKIIPVADIHSEITRSVVNKINYSSVIVDNSTPLKNGIYIDSIDLYRKGENLTVGIAIGTDIFYLDKTGVKGQRPVTTIVSINIFKKEELVQEALDINEAFLKVFNDTDANNFEFISSKGNLENTKLRLENSMEVESDLKSKVINIDKTGTNVTALNAIGLTWKVDSSTIADASRFETKSERGDTLAGIATVNHARTGSAEDQEFYFRQIKDDINGQWLYPIINEDDEFIEEMSYAISKDKTISKSINQYNLAYNISENDSIRNIVEAQNSKFAIDYEKDKLAIALFGISFKGTTFTLDGQEYEFPEQTVFYRQKTSFSSTKELYEQFVTDAFNYQAELLGMVGRDLREEKDITRPFYHLESDFKYPGGFSGFNKMIKTEDRIESVLTANKKANQYSEGLELTSVIVNKDTNSKPEYFSSRTDYTGGYNPTETMRLFFHNGYNSRIDYISFKTYFFSSAINNPNKVSYCFDETRNGRVNSFRNERELIEFRLEWISRFEVHYAK
ncbi:lipoprotein [Spiroplasma alleghenense]|uniref:Lipoprotein n=1 Tax=Spiroplasma alleghenense TaxID=216931 RepID=A0A345Z559_9MOLU|nr:lipoprotein [Spiroplasma alleghenense]AXK51738.1 hypothetical protein SALLE_v1c10680 [Spiroplasma alleghenense]